MRRFAGWVLLICSLPIAAAVEPPGENRDRLTVADLKDGDQRLEAIHNAYFVPVGETRPARHEFAGTLTFAPTPMHLSDKLTPWQGWFPGVSVRFISHRGYLIPVERDIVRSKGAHTRWGIVFSPGRVWSEPSDGEWSRASFPFVLTGPHYNESHMASPRLCTTTRVCPE